MEIAKLSPTHLAFIALANEYCEMVENVNGYERATWVEALVKLLPRLYITAVDLEPSLDYADASMVNALDEDTYNAVRQSVAAGMGEDDVYLEVFMNDMQYSDTPIATSISENIADLYQEFYNLVASLQDLSTEHQQELVDLCRENFMEYWGQTLCNVLRALHMVHTSQPAY